MRCVSRVLRKSVPLIISWFFFSGSAFGQITYAVGLLSGLTVPYTWDAGVYRDPRYSDRYSLKFAPVTLHLGIDKLGYGLMADPGIFSTGQRFHVVNTVGGIVGTRDINMTYAQVPFGLKVHIIDLSFFRISFISSLSVAYLLNAEEDVRHVYGRLKFPEEVYPILPSEYIVDYDGVLSPEVPGYRMLQKGDFKSYQTYVSAGLRSDWDINEGWRVSMDLRVSYGIFEPRTKSYLDRVENYQTLYDLSGRRRDLFMMWQAGICRILEIDRHVARQQNPRLHNEQMPERKARREMSKGMQNKRRK